MILYPGGLVGSVFGVEGERFKFSLNFEIRLFGLAFPPSPRMKILVFGVKADVHPYCFSWTISNVLYLKLERRQKLKSVKKE